MNSITRFFLISVLAAAVSCKHHPTELEPETNGTGVQPYICDPDTIYFQNTILPLINSSCARPECHDATTHEEGLVLDSYQNIMSSGIVQAGNPWNSEMVEVILEDDPDDMMPPDGPLSQAQIDQIIAWIAQGALNNYCPNGCDENAVVTYQDIIWPMVNSNCTSCHKGNNAGGGIYLENYTQISSIALSGQLMDALLGANGSSLMPKGSQGLSSCQIGQFQQWIDAGAPQ